MYAVMSCSAIVGVSRQNHVEGNHWNRVAPAPTLIKLTADEAVITQLIIIYAALKGNCGALIRYANL